MVSSDIALSLSHATTFKRLGSCPKRVHVWCSGPTRELWLISAVRPASSDTQGRTMKLFEIEIGRSYKCDRKDGQYVATVKEKQDGRVGVALRNEVGIGGDPGDALDSRGLIWLKPANIHPL
jgi:hypothetical protein